MIIHQLALFCFLSKIFSVTTHLHHTLSSTIPRSYFDCLYVHHHLYARNNVKNPYVDAWSLIPYCRRDFELSSTLNQNECQGERVTFDELRSRNISVEDLFIQRVSVDLLNDYEKFLRDEEIYNSEEKVLCQCPRKNQFGANCQYTLKNLEIESYETIIDSYFRNGFDTMSETCYEGSWRKKCAASQKCLHWREICDGYFDCELGEDEKDCFNLEANQCEEDQYRCQNGLCIPLSFSFDYIYDCLDRSDESQGMSKKRLISADRPLILDEPVCSTNPSMFCEEYSCTYLEQSCDTVRCVSRFDLNPLKSGCLSKQKKQLWIDAFSPNSSQLHFDCWYALMCLMGLENFFLGNAQRQRCSRFCSLPQIRRSRERADGISLSSTKVSLNCQWMIQKSCPGKLFNYPRKPPEILFPPNIILRNNRSDPHLHQAGLPQEVCFDSTHCDQRRNRTCLTLNEMRFPVTQSTSYWQFYNFLKRFFVLNCHPPSSSSQNLTLNLTNLYKCKGTKRLISVNRRGDDNVDCPASDDQSLSFREVCSLNLTDRMRCPTGCIPQRLVLARNPGDVCYFSEFSLIAQCFTPADRYPFACRWLRDGWKETKNMSIFDVFRFWQLCDGHLDDDNGNDEQDCRLWKQTCHRRAQQCNGHWDCLDGSDEEGCGETNPLLSLTDYRYCFTRTQLISLHFSRVGDGKIDCLGSTDERAEGFCLFRYPREPSRRFRCVNTSECIRVEEICDGVDDCPSGDDEWPCPWRKQLSDHRTCSNRMFACPEDTQCRINGAQRCFVNQITEGGCRNREDLWFCDLIDRDRVYHPISLSDFNEFPIFDKLPNSFLSMNGLTTNILFPTETNPIATLNCHRGLPVGNNLCLCPPSYFGKFCQFQNDRISIHLQVRFPSFPDDDDDHAEFIRLVVKLRNERNESVDQEEFLLHYLVSKHKHLFYLVYPNPNDEHLFYSVSFDIFRISFDSVEFLSREIRSIPFGFLPVNRLALTIDLPDRFASVNPRNLSISTDGICPLGRMGKDCHYRFNPCLKTNPCINGGTCYPFDLRLSQFTYVCLCTSIYHGRQCQLASAQVSIHLSSSVQRQWAPSTETNEVPLVVVYFAYIYSGIPQLNIDNHFIYSDVQYDSSFSVIAYRRSFLAQLIFVQIFYDADRTDYFLVGLHQRSVRWERSSILASHRCSPVDEIFSNGSHRKLYHRACYQTGLQCFYDQSSMCLCDQRGRFECLQFKHQASTCPSSSTFCLNDGICRRSSLTKKYLPFACACPKCYYGDLCQFTTTQYAISLDALQINRALVIVVNVLLILGSWANLLAISVFLREKPSKDACGLYLRVVSIISQMGLMGFAFKLIYLYFQGPNARILCIGLEYFLTVIPSIFDWLTACLAVERSVIFHRGLKYNQQSNKRTAKWIITCLILFHCLSNVHEGFFRRLIADPRSIGQSWCVTEYPKNSQWLSSFRKTMNIFHIVVPFSINFGSTFVLLIRLVSKKQTIKTSSFITLFVEQISLIKHCLIAPCLLLLFGTPRLILLFLFSCIESSRQEFIYLLAYLLSILPMMATLFIFVLPSTNYYRELKQTQLIRWLSCLIRKK